MPTMGAASGVPPIDPMNGAPEENTPPSAATNVGCRLAAPNHRSRAPLRAVVAIFETHHIIEFGGAGLKDNRVLQGRHPMSSTGAEMNRLAGE